MSRSHIIGVPGIAHITDHVTGSVTLVPGVPITATRELQAALLPSLGDDTDAIHAPTAGAARSTRYLLNLLRSIAEKGAAFKSLRYTWGRHHGGAWSMLTVLAGLADFEREVIRTRTGKGREGAKARDINLRKPKLSRHQSREAIAR